MVMPFGCVSKYWGLKTNPKEYHSFLFLARDRNSSPRREGHYLMRKNDLAS